MRRILIATDGSPASEDAVHVGIEYAVTGAAEEVVSSRGVLHESKRPVLVVRDVPFINHPGGGVGRRVGVLS